MKPQYTIGVDVGGTKIAAALVNDKGQILSRCKTPTPVSADGKTVYSTIAETIELVRKDVKPKSIAGIGLGIPGIADPKTFAIIVTPNIKLAGFPLKEQLTKQFRCKIIIDNDVNCGLMGEKWLGAAKNKKNVIGLFPGTGIGGAILIDGKLITGTQGAAAELGHMIMMINGPTCSCGNKGCLEALASRWAIQRDIKAAIKSGRKSLISELSKNNLAVIKSKALKQALQSKDEVVVEIMTRAAHALGQACISINHIFNPEMIVLGGGVIEACGGFMLNRIKKIAASDPFFKKFNPCQICEAQLKDDAVILGAARLVKDYA